MARLVSVASIFLSAFLLFLVQPMIAKMELPLFGGSPAVWTTCLLFFQGLLLIGYGYSHWLSRRALGTQIAVHGALVLVPLFFLPPGIDPDYVPPPDAWPIPSLLGALAVAIGLPFLALSTNSSLVQHWYARRSNDEPYFLYSASNAASLLALLAYPALFEPMFGLGNQARIWAAGYLLFLVATGAVMLTAWRGVPIAAAARPVDHVPGAPPTWSQRVRWTFLSAVASTILVSASIHLTTDVAAVPLLWVLPLGLYLVTFIIAFMRRPPNPRPVAEWITTALIAAAMASIAINLRPPWVVELAITLGVVFFGCWICHSDVARERPSGEHVTDFYLWLAVGGFLGGFFGNIVAPLVFDSAAEYPLSLVLLAVVLATGAVRTTPLGVALRQRSAWWAPAAMTAFALAGSAVRLDPAISIFWRLVPILLLAAGLVLRKRDGAFAFSVLVVAGLVLGGLNTEHEIKDAERSFFGVVRVVERKGIRYMDHGTTTHGAQRIAPADPSPIGYYHPQSPMGSVFAALPAGKDLAVIGLGTGGLAGFGEPGQRLTFFELDPIVEPIARKWFSYMPASTAELRTVTGDARLTIAREPDASMDVLLLDAFSSDTIPMHLLTREAFTLWLRKLRPDGLLLVHISNKHVDLVPVMKGIAAEHGLALAIAEYRPTEADDPAARATDVAAFSRDPAALATLPGGFAPVPPGGRTVSWTDDRSSLLSVLRGLH